MGGNQARLFEEGNENRVMIMSVTYLEPAVGAALDPTASHGQVLGHTPQWLAQESNIETQESKGIPADGLGNALQVGDLVCLKGQSQYTGQVFTVEATDVGDGRVRVSLQLSETAVSRMAFDPAHLELVTEEGQQGASQAVEAAQAVEYQQEPQYQQQEFVQGAPQVVEYQQQQLAPQQVEYEQQQFAPQQVVQYQQQQVAPQQVEYEQQQFAPQQVVEYEQQQFAPQQVQYQQQQVAPQQVVQYQQQQVVQLQPQQVQQQQQFVEYAAQPQPVMMMAGHQQQFIQGQPPMMQAPNYMM